LLNADKLKPPNAQKAAFLSSEEECEASSDFFDLMQLQDKMMMISQMLL